ncbi:hypothetical protein ABZT08_28860 [Streptomyces sp. NPDC005526]|uniref:hypothetical protein n=1 Tax=Streptomyces sp. NPDC005526 TaxID=3156885 RepID=UPI0033B3249F
MNFLAEAMVVAFMGCAYAWPVIALAVYPLNRRRGFWAALYCCAIALFFGIEFHSFKFMVGEFFEVAVYTSAVRILAEALGVLEKPRNVWRKRHERVTH